MKEIDTLVVTTKQSNTDILKKMNIKTNTILANQAGEYAYIEDEINGCKVKMITTDTIGVGKNRNQALLLSDADICLLSDDDMEYKANYKEIIKKAFEEIPKADMIIFNIDTKGATVKRRKNDKIKRVSILNFQNYGAVRIAFKRESIIYKNIWFSTLFGGGTIYSSGEDSIFLREALKKHLKIYTYPETIGVVNQEKSTWFRGYNEKFFYDKGALLGAMFPIMKYVLGIAYYPFRFKTDLSIRKVTKMILQGIKGYKFKLDYDSWKMKENIKDEK